MSIERWLSSGPNWQGVSFEEAVRLAVDGMAPEFHAAPLAPEQVAATLRAASAEGLAVRPRGAGTKMGLGNRSTRYDLALETGGLTAVLEYRPDDLVAVALAGTPLAAAQALFAEYGQWLALDPPFAATTTIGGTLACNQSGPHRLRYGTARDLVLGMQVAYPDGTLARSGAKVVKNVAGYDVHKMHVGALGTLGVIVEVALRLHPLPAERRILACVPPSDNPPWLAMASVVGGLLRLPLGLGAIEALNGEAGRRLAVDGFAVPAGDLLLVVCEGHPSVVGRQADEVGRAAAAAGLWTEEIATGDGVARLTAALAEARAPGERDETVLKLSVPLGDTLPSLAELATALPGAPVIAHAGSGVVHALPKVATAEVPLLVAQLRAWARGRGGHLVVQHCAPEAKIGLDVWGPVAAPRLVRGLKAALDPTSTLNPGRFVEGL
ncbi:MAG TPA: FAD-binding oxidoreductase [Chloroflexota bacterium]|nr:FAD-binding oxidoreductase [Chloroflexota bacterium]